MLDVLGLDVSFLIAEDLNRSDSMCQSCLDRPENPDVQNGLDYLPNTQEGKTKYRTHI